MKWIVTANSNLCRIYHCDKSLEPLSLVKEINHPENKLKAGDSLTSDRPGHYQTAGSGGGAYSPRTDPKDVEVDNFFREVSLELNHGRTLNSYDKLIIITPSHMNGILFAHLDRHVKALVTHEIQKDVMHLSLLELLDFLRLHLKIA